MLMFVIIGLGLGPMAIDGFTQLLTSYESTNTMRILTGFPAGFIGGWIFSAMFSARPNEFESAERSPSRKCHSTNGLMVNSLATN